MKGRESADFPTYPLHYIASDKWETGKSADSLSFKLNKIKQGRGSSLKQKQKEMNTFFLGGLCADPPKKLSVFYLLLFGLWRSKPFVVVEKVSQR